MRCMICWVKTDTLTVLKSKTKGKTIRLCARCFNKKRNSLIKGHGYLVLDIGPQGVQNK